jgi:2-keto-4-pentenoate hydratase/2-oxohepta-3-ene-1,7-dioic acid hydratase in catechol pathway
MKAMLEVYSTDLGAARRRGEQLEIVSREPLQSIIEAGLVHGIAQLNTIETIPLAHANLSAPVAPGKFVLIGLNYEDHAREAGHPIPDTLMFAPCSGDAVAAPGAEIRLPIGAAQQVDFEVECAVVIGKRVSGLGPDDHDVAAAAVAGLSVCFDLTARDVQMEAFQQGGADMLANIARSKAFAGFKPLGPGLLLAPAHELATLDLPISLHLNGEQRQSSTTAQMVFSIPRIVAEISRVMPLEPGDVICTGTPAGVGMFGETFLRPGDRLEGRLGALPPLVVTIAAP